MAANKSIPTADSEKESYSYPANLATIPYASFLRIHKYSYDVGMSEVGASQNDAIGSLQNSGMLKQINEKLTKTAEWVYGDKTGGRGLLAFDNDTEIINNYRQQLKDKKIIHTDMELPNSELLDMKFDVDNGWGAGHSETTLRELIDKKNEVKEFHESGYDKDYCDLAMPNEFQYDYSANWNNTFKLGTMALAADDPARAAIVLGSGAVIGGVAGTLTTYLTTKNEQGQGLGLDKLAGIAGNTKAGITKAGDFFGVNSNILDPTNIAGMAGLAPNENAIQFFKKMDFRQFDLNFEFAARNKLESAEIQKILKWFKEGMHPVSKDPLGSGTGVLLGFPDVWKLEPRFTPGKQDGNMVEGGADIAHPMMPATKLCALTQIRVNTSPMGSFATVFDGTIPLITVTLRFNELTALTRQDFMDNPNY